MRIHFLILPLFATLPMLPAQEPATGLEMAGVASAAREAALDNLLSERESPEALDQVIAKARKTGVSEQAILEARFLFHVDRGEDAEIAAMLPEFMSRRDTFKPEDSAIFGVMEDWLAVVEYVQAIHSLQKGDKAGFKQHITEAFWLGPRQAAAFAPHIERLRLEEAMRSVRIDFSRRYDALDSGKPVALSTLMEGKKAMLLHFWSPQSRECEASLPDFSKTAALLQANGIAVVSLLPAGPAADLTEARAMALPYAGAAGGSWLVDSAEKSIGRELRVQDLPAMAIIAPDGSVFYNGDPTDDEFWKVLRGIDSRIERPQSPIERAE